MQEIQTNTGFELKPKHFKKKLGLKKIIFFGIIVVALVIFLITPPIIMNDMINGHVNFQKIYQAEEFGLTSEKVMLRTTDGMDIAAYEVTVPNPKAVIIFISGIHNPSVTAFYGHSKTFMENGYASILMEMRAHGESTGDTISLGYKEYLDTQAVVKYITEQPQYKDVPIVVYGVSMGGATAINSTGQIQDIDGLISLSAFSSWEDVFCDNMINMGFPAIYTTVQKPFVKLYTTWLFGLENYDITPVKQINMIGDRPALLIHSEGDTQVPFRSFERLVKAAPEHVETWSRQGNLHFIVGNSTDFTEPQKDKEYVDKVIGFLDKNFGNK